MAEGPAKRSYRAEDWDARLRYVPTPAQVRRLLASNGVEACRERWGGDYPSHLIRKAERPRRGTRVSA
ncbi:hypothetical protein [uncultured Methylobacterium sp.]|uniref:hypothetical protein n=1 Tax=uncultured Methylobacterium sp. TaxID=157278 RepID=UPI0035CB00C5